MTETPQEAMLRRKLRPALAMPSPADAADAASPSPARALRTTFARIAGEVAGLTVNVLGVQIDEAPLDDLLSRLPQGLVLLSVDGATGPVGLAAADGELRAALIEKATTGRLVPAKAETDRKVTRTDTALVAPLFARFLAELPAAVAGTALGGWIDGFGIGAPCEDLRALSLTLENGDYRLVRMTLDFGVAERQGELILAVAMAPQPGPVLTDANAASAGPGQWTNRLRASVMEAPAVLTAVLHWMRLPVGTVEGFRVGQVIALPGVTVASVRLEGPGDTVLARARLGQMSGLRAVRIETQGAPVLQEGGVAGVARPVPDRAPVAARPIAAPADA